MTCNLMSGEALIVLGNCQVFAIVASVEPLKAYMQECTRIMTGSTETADNWHATAYSKQSQTKASGDVNLKQARQLAQLLEQKRHHWQQAHSLP